MLLVNVDIGPGVAVVRAAVATDVVGAAAVGTAAVADVRADPFADGAFDAPQAASTTARQKVHFLIGL